MRDKRALTALVTALGAALLLAACGGGGGNGSTATTAATTPTAAPKRPPLIGGFYAGRTVNYVLTDVSTQKDAKGLSKATKYPVNFVPALANLPDAATAKLYLFMNGVKGPNPFGFQANVLDSLPGEAGYSPLWRVYAVTWAKGAKPRLLKSEADILTAKGAGDVSVTLTPLIKNSPVVPNGKNPPLVGGFYDGKAVDYLLTDVSTKKDAKGLSKATHFPVNYAPALNSVPASSTAKLYLFMNGVKGPNPFGFQANVLDSLPGKPGYSPLWRVYAVMWAKAAKPRLLKSEAEILNARGAGEVSVTLTPLVKNSPVVPSG
jgi:hypothetical protein